MSTVAYHQGAYFLGTQNNTILIVNSTTHDVINSIKASGTNSIRDMIFLKDGQTMVVALSSNQQLFFFNRSNITLRNYTFASNRSVAYTLPHGLLRVNDTLFYATSWDTKKHLLVCDEQ